MNELIIGTDFSGIGAPEQALIELQQEGALKFKSVFSCEIDKYARTSYEALYGKGKVYEDITKRDHSEVPKLDLYIAGFPCQAFSLAGKRMGFEEARGTLFFNVAEFIKINQPECFILENVKGLLSHDSGKTFSTIISILSDNGGTVNGQHSIPYYDDGLGYHVYYQVLNTKEHGLPQNRERIFIVGFKKERDYRFLLPEKLNLKLKDVLEKEVDEKYYLSDKIIKGFLNKKDAHLYPFKPLNEDSSHTPCLTARYFKMGATDPYIKIGAIRGRNEDNPKSRKSGLPTKQMLELNENGTSNCLTSVQKDNVVVTDKIRRLTPLECWRLQGFPNKQFYKAQQVNSDTQLYRQAGNSISVPVIKKVIKNIL